MAESDGEVPHHEPFLMEATMSKRMFEDEIELNGFVHNVRWQGLFNPSQNGGMTDPSWGAHWEVDGPIEVEIFGQWFGIGFLGFELCGNIQVRVQDYMEDFQGSMEFLGDTHE